jgi:hypothetical protein
MKAKTLLRISIIPILIKLLGHSIGHMGWDKPDDPKMQAVVNTMKNYTGHFMGASYNMAAYLTGYSLMILIIYALLSYLLWILSNSFNLQSNVANHFIYAIAITLLIYSVLEFLYFFPFAASMSLLASVLMIFSTIVAKKKQST